MLNAEYDALPGIGHACGHNLIAASALAAYVGLAAALAQADLPGRVRLLGTPAEEGGGGKLRLLSAGAYNAAAAALMLHPGPSFLAPRPAVHQGIGCARLLGAVHVKARFAGREAHAAMAPWEGANALDAAALAYTAAAMLRQHIRPGERLHGVIVEGGAAANIVPASAALEFTVRSATRRGLDGLYARVVKCFEGAAAMTGCEVRVEEGMRYADLRPVRALCEAWKEAMPAGTVYNSYGDEAQSGASTDMGDVSYAVPSFHGFFLLQCEPGQGNHTPGFAAAAGTEDAFQRALQAAKGMAAVGWKVLADDEFAGQVKAEWEEDMARLREG